MSATDRKNGRPHSVPLNQAAMEVLERRQGDHPTHVFTYEGNPVAQVNTKAWRNALQRAGIQDFGGMISGIPLRHGIERYAHVAPADGLQKAANRLDRLLIGA